MRRANDGGPAFPQRDYDEEGMSVREVYAGLAMLGMILTDLVNDAFERLGHIDRDPLPPATSPREHKGQYITEAAFALADMMIAESEKGKNDPKP